MDKELLIKNVKTACERRNISVKFALESAGVSKDYIVNLRRTQSKSLSDTVALSAFLGVSVSELVGDSPRYSVPSEFAAIWAQLDAVDRAQIVGFARGLAAAEKYIKTEVDLDQSSAG